MTYPKMKPCPNCKDADNLNVFTYDNGCRHVECVKCNYLGPACTSIAHAIRHYNKEQDARAALTAPEDGVAVSASQDGDHSLTSGRGISQVRPLEDETTVAPSGDPDFREIDAIDVAAANIRADYRAGNISKEQFQREMLIVSRARQQESAALSAPEAEG